MKIVLFTSGGEMGLLPLEALAGVHEVAAVVLPARGPLLRRMLKRTARAVGLRRDPIREWAGRTRLPVLDARSGNDGDLVAALQRIGPELICISAFPWILGAPVLQLPHHGVLNVHPSLLPRHRGPNPYFWTYYHGDRETGVTVHVASRRADAGPMLLQRAFDVPRGYGIGRLHSRCARLGASLLVEAVSLMSRGEATLTAQADGDATAAPRVGPGKPMVDYEWDVEQVWHFLAGLFPKFREPLRHGGRPVDYRAVLDYKRTETGSGAGEIETAPFGWKLHCKSGYVRLASAANAIEPSTGSFYT